MAFNPLKLRNMNIFKKDLMQLRNANAASLVADVNASTGASVPVDDATKALIEGATTVKLVAVGPLKIAHILKENSEKVRIPTGLNTAKFSCQLQANGVNFAINLHSVTLYAILQGGAQCTLAFYENVLTKPGGYWLGLTCAGQPAALSAHQIDELENMLAHWAKKSELPMEDEIPIEPLEIEP